MIEAELAKCSLDLDREQYCSHYEPVCNFFHGQLVILGVNDLQVAVLGLHILSIVHNVEDLVLQLVVALVGILHAPVPVGGAGVGVAGQDFGT